MYIGHSSPTSVAYKSPEAYRTLACPTQYVSAPANIVLNTSAAAIQRVYCYAVASSAANVQENFGLLSKATPHSFAALGLRATSSDCKIAQVQKFKERLAKRTRMRTLASRAHEQFPGNACKASPCAFNFARLARDNLYTLRAPQPRNEILSTSARALMPTVLPEWQHLHCAVIAIDYELNTRTRCDVRTCIQLEIAPLYIKCCSSQHSPFYSQSLANLKLSFATRTLFFSMMSCEQEDRLFNSVIIRGQRVESAIIGRLRECAVYEVCIEGLDCAFLAFLASESHSSMRAALLARINAVVMPLGALYYNAIIASKVDAIELTHRTLARDTAVVLVYRFKVNWQRAARDLSDMLLLHYDEHQFPIQPTTKY